MLRCFPTETLIIPHRAKSVDVRIGSIDREIDEDGEIHRTSKDFVLHPNFKHEPEVRNDLGILILSTPVKLSESNTKTNVLQFA